MGEVVISVDLGHSRSAVAFYDLSKPFSRVKHPRLGHHYSRRQQFHVLIAWEPTTLFLPKLRGTSLQPFLQPASDEVGRNHFGSAAEALFAASTASASSTLPVLIFRDLLKPLTTATTNTAAAAGAAGATIRAEGPGGGEYRLEEVVALCLKAVRDRALQDSDFYDQVHNKAVKLSWRLAVSAQLPESGLAVLAGAARLARLWGPSSADEFFVKKAEAAAVFCRSEPVVRVAANAPAGGLADVDFAAAPDKQRLAVFVCEDGHVEASYSEDAAAAGKDAGGLRFVKTQAAALPAAAPAASLDALAAFVEKFLRDTKPAYLFFVGGAAADPEFQKAVSTRFASAGARVAFVEQPQSAAVLGAALFAPSGYQKKLAFTYGLKYLRAPWRPTEDPLAKRRETANGVRCKDAFDLLARRGDWVGGETVFYRTFVPLRQPAGGAGAPPEIEFFLCESESTPLAYCDETDLLLTPVRVAARFKEVRAWFSLNDYRALFKFVFGLNQIVIVGSDMTNNEEIYRGSYAYPPVPAK